MAGLQLTAQGIQDRSGVLVVAAWDALDACRDFYLWLNDATHNDAALGPSGVGVPSADLTLIRNTFGDLAGPAGLWAVAHGSAHPAANNDFFFNAKNLTGLTYTGSAS